ncbi:MAG: sodium:solute symporter [Bacteroidales bacterium]|nr:sodium:solute symporter [Bacteroidales bacterium]
MQVFIFSFFLFYVVLLFVIMWITSKKADNKTYFTGNRKSPWFVVAYGMIGSSLSGVTFMSVPGDVYSTQFTYFGVVLGYILGYLVIGCLLLPLYYKLNVTSVYEYLGTRIGKEAHKTGSVLFFISRLLGSALRMYLVIFVLQVFVFDGWHIPIWLTSVVMIAIILLYTFRGGLKTVVWTDLLQTTFLLGALVITIVVIMKNMGGSFSEVWQLMSTAGKDGGDCRLLFNTDWRNNSFFLKQIIGGMFITIAMTGLDQDMMQKNLSCKSLKDAQRNMLSFTSILVVVNVLFLMLGGMLLAFAQKNGIDLANMPTDRIYPEIAFKYLGKAGALVFVFGLISAGFSSADGTFTALTTTVCYDILRIEKRYATEAQQTKIRRVVHLLISMLFLTVIIIASAHHNDALIRIIFMVASYTYGPLLGMFIFGMFTKREIAARRRWLVPVIAVLIPTLCYVLSSHSQQWLCGYKFGYELLIVNGMLVFGSLMAISKRALQEEKIELKS